MALVMDEHTVEKISEYEPLTAVSPCCQTPIKIPVELAVPGSSFFCCDLWHNTLSNLVKH